MPLRGVAGTPRTEQKRRTHIACWLRDEEANVNVSAVTHELRERPAIWPWAG